MNDEEKAQKLIIEQMCNAIDSLESHFQKFCEATKGTSVPMVYIKESMKIYKENLKKGANL